MYTRHKLANLKTPYSLLHVHCKRTYFAYDIEKVIYKANFHWYSCHAISEWLELLNELTCLLIEWTQQCSQVTKSK